MFNKLRNRFLILNMSIISVVMIFAFVAIYFTTYASMLQENRGRLNALANVRAPFREGVGRMVVARAIPADYSLFFNVYVSESGEILQVNSHIDKPVEEYTAAVDSAWKNRKKDSTLSFDGKLWMYRITPLNMSLLFADESKEPKTVVAHNNNFNITFLDITDSSTTLNRLCLSFVMVGVLMLFVIFAISLYFANKSIKPIMAAWDKQKRFIADASHELKTPLAFISANSDALLANQEDTIVNQRRWLDSIRSETSRMGKLISDLLYLARTEDTVIHYAPMNLSDVINDVMLSSEAMVFEREIELVYTVMPDVVISGNNEQVIQLVMILLDNAVKYTDRGGKISVELKSMKNQVILSVSNTGKGISKEDLPNIFDRFYRADKAREHDDNSYGLGLSIAQTIATQMNGRLVAHSVPNVETTFSLIINI